MVPVHEQPRKRRGRSPGHNWAPAYKMKRRENDKESRYEERPGCMTRGEAELVRADSKGVVSGDGPSPPGCRLETCHNNNVDYETEQEVYFDFVQPRFVEHPAEGHPAYKPNYSMARYLERGNGAIRGNGIIRLMFNTSRKRQCVFRERKATKFSRKLTNFLVTTTSQSNSFLSANGRFRPFSTRVRWSTGSVVIA